MTQMLFSKRKSLISLLLFLWSSLGIGQGFSPIYSCPGPYACIISSYLGLQFPDGTHQTTAASGGGGSGTVTSVAFADGSTLPLFTITGSPVIAAGTITATLATQTANKVFSGPTSGGAAQPTFRSLVASDIPSLSYVPTSRSISTTAPLSGGGALSGDLTLAIPLATSGANGYLSSTDWSLFNGKQNSGTYITSLTGDVTATGPGSVAATVANVGASTAANVSAATVLANAATNANTLSAIVKRDASGNFAAGTITAALTGTASGNPPNGRLINTTAPIAGGGDLSADRTISIPFATGAADGYLKATDFAIFSAKQPAITVGDLTDVGTDGISITSGVGAVIGGGTSISQQVSNATQNGYLSSTDWSAFNAKQAAGSYLVDGGALGTPSSGTATNLSGTAASLTAGVATAANGLKTATTTVSISGATAPSSGQTLVATSSTNATWQTPSGGGVATPSVSGTVTSFVPVALSGTVTKTANYTITDTDGFKTIICNPGGSTITMTFPAASASNQGRVLTLLRGNTSASDRCALAGADIRYKGLTIGSANAGIGLYDKGHSLTLASDGSNWYVTNEQPGQYQITGITWTWSGGSGATTSTGNKMWRITDNQRITFTIQMISATGTPPRSATGTGSTTFTCGGSCLTTNAFAASNGNMFSPVGYSGTGKTEYVPVPVWNNGALASQPGLLTINGAGGLSLQLDGSGSAFTNSAVGGFAGNFTHTYIWNNWES